MSADIHPADTAVDHVAEAYEAFRLKGFEAIKAFIADERQTIDDKIHNIRAILEKM